MYVSKLKCHSQISVRSYIVPEVFKVSAKIWLN